MYMCNCFFNVHIHIVCNVGMGASVWIPIDLQNGEKLLLVVMADGVLLYRRSKIKVVMSQAETVATVLNEGVQSARAQIPFFRMCKRRFTQRAS